jgi:hypothetical protein
VHTFFALKDGSFIAFFEAPDQPFDFRRSMTSTCTSRWSRTPRKSSG